MEARVPRGGRFPGTQCPEIIQGVLAGKLTD